jgi:hypothetical protein
VIESLSPEAEGQVPLIARNLARVHFGAGVQPPTPLLLLATSTSKLEFLVGDKFSSKQAVSVLDMIEKLLDEWATRQARTILADSRWMAWRGSASKPDAILAAATNSELVSRMRSIPNSMNEAEWKVSRWERVPEHIKYLAGVWVYPEIPGHDDAAGAEREPLPIQSRVN